MTQEQFTTIILQPEEGKYLTQVADVDIIDRVVAKRVALGACDSPSNWREISMEEGDEYNRLRKKAIEEGSPVTREGNALEDRVEKEQV